jgi:hypothetical protein
MNDSLPPLVENKNPISSGCEARGGGEHEHLSAFHYVRLLYIEESSLEAKMRGSGFNYGVHSYMHIFYSEENIEKQARKCAGENM